MTESSDFQPDEKSPILGVTNRNVGSWTRWLLPFATGAAIALIVLYLT